MLNVRYAELCHQLAGRALVLTEHVHGSAVQSELVTEYNIVPSVLVEPKDPVCTVGPELDIFFPADFSDDFHEIRFCILHVENPL